MKKSIKFFFAAFVVIVAASCSKPAETSSEATDSAAVTETPAPVEPAPADSTADTTNVAQ